MREPSSVPAVDVPVAGRAFHRFEGRKAGKVGLEPSLERAPLPQERFVRRLQRSGRMQGPVSPDLVAHVGVHVERRAKVGHLRG